MTILVVEQNLLCQLAIDLAFANSGCQLVVVRDAPEAIEYLRACSRVPDALLTELDLPGMDGFELLAEIRHDSRLRALPAFVLCAGDSQEHAHIAAELNIAACMTKRHGPLGLEADGVAARVLEHLPVPARAAG